MEGTTNRELFASANVKLRKIWKKNTAKIRDRELQNLMYEVSQQLTPCEKGEYILTDDKAPVELLGIQVIDGIIEREVEYYKGIYEEQGLSGLLEML